MTDFADRVRVQAHGISLKQTLKQLYVAGQDDYVREDIHASDVLKPDTSFCYRQIVLAAFHHPQPQQHPHPRIAHFERGIDMHKRWQTKFLRAGKVIYRMGLQGIELVHEVNFDVGVSIPDSKYNWKLLFTPDGIVDIGGGIEILELKGYNQATYAKLMKDMTNPPHDAYVQASLYMWLTGIHQVLLIVENKNTQDFHPWRVAFDEAVIAPYETRLLTIDAMVGQYVQSERLPKRICSTPQVPRACACPFRDVCFASPQERAARKK